MAAEIQLPECLALSFPAVVFAIIQSTTAPETSRIVEKLAGSIRASPSAILQRIELAAKATSAKVVSSVICSLVFIYGEDALPVLSPAPIPSGF